MLEREDDIRKMMSEGAERRHIVEELHKKYKVARRTIEDHYYRIAKDIGIELSENREEVAARIIEMKMDLYKRSIARHKYKTADDILNGIAKMANLFDSKGSIAREVPKISLVTADFSRKASGDDSGETD